MSKVKTFNIPFLPNLYRGLGTVLVLTLAGLSIAHAAANCSSLFSQVNVATTYGVPLVKGRIAPLQSHAGMAEVKTKFEDFNDEAKLVASIKGQPARDAAWSIIVRESNTTVEGYIDPEGVLRPADAHHKLLAILKLMEDYGFPRESVEWKLKVPVENDFSGRSWEEFGKHIEDRGIRYLSSDEEDLSRQLGETPGQRIRRIPTEFDLMKNSPMRSVTGRFFSLIGVKGTTLKPMAQFETERDLMHDLAVSPKAGGEYDTKLQGRILFLFFRSAQSETLTQNLIGRAHPELRGLVSDSLKKSGALFNRLYDQFANSPNAVSEFSEVPGFSKNDPPEAQAAALLTALTVDEGRILFPKNALLIANEARYDDLLKTAEKDAFKKIDWNNVKAQLDRAVSNPESLNRENKKLLRQAGTAATNLRSAYRLFAESHGGPAVLNDLNQDLERLNDLLAKLPLGKASSTDVKVLATDLQARLKDVSASGLELRFAGATATSLQSFLSDQSARTTWFQRALSNPMTVADIRQLDQQLREYSTLFKAVGALEPSIGNDLLTKALSKLKDRTEITVGALEDKPAESRASIDPASIESLNHFVILIQDSTRELRSTSTTILGHGSVEKAGN